ncbi:MAG: hypothetical protein SWY16_18245 [Cyanobacteriota bacterium]|nr:hypothetical protein [Cyanobacteriota bacterium]
MTQRATSDRSSCAGVGTDPNFPSSIEKLRSTPCVLGTSTRKIVNIGAIYHPKTKIK